MQQKIIIITAPSGSGKTSVIKYLLQQFPFLQFSISATTRSPRVGETDGKDYYFITPDTFRQNIADDAFAEWEMVYENKYYGTLRSELERIWNNKHIPLVDIDVKGALRIQESYRNNCISIFIQPPSIEELKSRLINRGTETAESLKERVDKAVFEMQFSHEFDVIITNTVLTDAQKEAAQIITDFLDK